MTRATAPDPAEKLIAEINGHCGPHIIAGINGNLPPGWYAGNLQAMQVGGAPLVMTPARVVVFTSAGQEGRPLWGTPDIGAKLEVAATADHLRIADELARQLTDRIRKHESSIPGRVRIALAPGAVKPERATSGASGYDVRALEACHVQPGRMAKIRAGIHLEIPAGMEAQIRPRSGWAMRGLWVHLATIDSDYRGECWVIAANVSLAAIQVEAGERIAQLVVAQVAHPELEAVDAADMSPTERGAGGLGSTGAG